MEPRRGADRRVPLLRHRPALTAAATHVALLRGINVGGKHRLPMQDLVPLFVAAGARDVRTYIQSGNVVFRAPAAAAAAMPARIEAAILARLALRVPVVQRTAAELAAVLAANPFAGEPAERLHVGFLAGVPAAAHVAALDPARSPPDAFVVRGREIYLCAPNGVGKTRLTTAYFDARLATTSTFRNWRTVQALVALAAARVGYAGDHGPGPRRR